MANLENIIYELERKVDQINLNFQSLQDLMLFMNSTQETLIRSKNKENYLCQLTINTNKRMDQFRNEIPSKCKVSNICTQRVERGIYKILCSYIEQGAEAALEKVDLYLKSANKMFETLLKNEPNCDTKCFKNIIHTLTTLKDLMDNSKKSYSNDISPLDFSSPETWMEKFKEEELCDLLIPLSNAMRLKILKVLAKGGKTYSQLERESGIRSNLKFHLEKLIEANYIVKEQRQGKWRYFIHINGLKALKFLYELKSKLV